jgi:hypothetical protein
MMLRRVFGVLVVILGVCALGLLILKFHAQQARISTQHSPQGEPTTPRTPTSQSTGQSATDQASSSAIAKVPDIVPNDSSQKASSLCGRGKEVYENHYSWKLPICKLKKGFRTTEQQQALASGPAATMPATSGNSLDEAGFAVEIRRSKVPRSQQGIVVQNAINAGLVRGGNFKHPKPDPVHFQRDSGNRNDRIKEAQGEHKKGVTCEYTN